MKTLIVYYSFTNNNELLARTLQAKLNCDILMIEEVTKRTGFKIMLDLILDRTPKIKPHPFSIDSYELCIFIAPVWAGKIASPLKSFLVQEKNRINTYSFITICGGGAREQKEKLTESLTEIVGQKPGIVKELWTNDLLADEEKDTIKYTTGYRIQQKDLQKFSREIDDFVTALKEPRRRRDVVV